MARFEQHSEGAVPALRGTIRFDYQPAPLGVLANDSDPDGDPITAVLVSGPAHGTLTLNANGTFSYRPNLGWSGTDTFTYKVTDGTAESSPATVTLTVNPVNDPPVAAADSYTTAEDTPLSVPAPGVLANDSDEEGATLTPTVVSYPSRGSLTLNADSRRRRTATPSTDSRSSGPSLPAGPPLVNPARPVADRYFQFLFYHL